MRLTDSRHDAGGEIGSGWIGRGCEEGETGKTGNSVFYDVERVNLMLM